MPPTQPFPDPRLLRLWLMQNQYMFHIRRLWLMQTKYMFHIRRQYYVLMRLWLMQTQYMFHIRHQCHHLRRAVLVDRCSQNQTLFHHHMFCGVEKRRL